ncbi:MAG: glutamate 5-kinase [Parcubacteria group bacterium]|jgi:glutamate 5-kinase
MKSIVIKIGSRVLANKNGLLNKKVIADLVRDLAKVKNEKDIDILLVTSGAVAVGRANKKAANLKIEADGISYDKNTVHEQMLAASGQPKLMAFYTREFGKYKIDCAQILTTRADFAQREKYLSLRTVTKNLLKAGIVPIFNENDVLSPEELDFSDNDQLAGMVSAMIVAEKLIILTVVDGFLDGPVNVPGTKNVPVIKSIKDYIDKVDDSNISRGGMKSKLYIADLVTSLGIEMHIAHGGKKGIVSKIIRNEKCGTFFPAKAKKAKALKNWLAAGAASKGTLVVSTSLADVLRKRQTASVLFLGIEKIKGNFMEKDIVDVCDDSGILLGRGISRFGSESLKKEVEKYKKSTGIEKAKIKTSKIIAIHYDYFVFQ